MTNEISVLDKGFVRLVGYLVDLADTRPLGFDDHFAYTGFIVDHGHTLDAQIVRAARVSYGKGTKTVRDDEKLIRYLLKHEHWSPFEMVEFKFHVKAPIFVARQWFRHRTASVNEISARYSVVEDEFYTPHKWRLQDTKNKQGSVGELDELTNAHATDAYTEAVAMAFQAYEALLQAGVAREMARMVLPVSVYTQFYWKQDLRNLLHFLKLRLDDHAQWEIRQYAEAILRLIEPLVPITVQAWKEIVLEGKEA
ncbi:thymidylate synthase [Thermus phage P74-26]|uniref:Thymidylate synthase ThyX n=1 Tax=Thermus phage P74-26 TaxID=2914007 RepID=A7XXI6_BP742|nr:thymidylate synthase [Thermus phage P74-26]ABU96972.1 thymidylate synthase ThyX [Thermus phage P74-26]